MDGCMTLAHISIAILESSSKRTSENLGVLFGRPTGPPHHLHILLGYPLVPVLIVDSTKVKGIESRLQKQHTMVCRNIAALGVGIATVFSAQLDWTEKK